MFVGDEARLSVGFAAARVSLGNLARGSLLAEVSRRAYAEGITGLHGIPDADMGPRTPHQAAALPELMDVQARELVTRHQTAVLALRWEAWDPVTGLFPVLDADLTLTPDHPGSMLKLAGAYRPPPRRAGAGLDRAIVHQAASATVASFFSRIAEVLLASDADYIRPEESSP